MHTKFRLLALLPLLAATAAAQTFIVDSTNGPGTQFTDLQVAINQVPNGATLHVRPGSYGGIAVSKSLTIIGHRSATGAFPRLTANALFPGILIGSLSASQTVVISGFEVGGLNTGTAVCSVTNCVGSVLLEDVSFSFQIPFAIRISDSRSVHMSRVSVSAFLPGTTTPMEAPVNVRNSNVEFTRLIAQGYRVVNASSLATPALTISQGSLVTLIEPQLSGGASLVSSVPAGPGIFATGGVAFHVYGNANATSSGVSGGSNAFGRGGDGIVLQQNSAARVRGVPLTAGFGSGASPFVRDATSSMELNATDLAPSANLSGNVIPGGTVTFSLFAKPGAAAAMLVGSRPRLTPFPQTTLGFLSIESSFSFLVGTVPPTGRIQLPMGIPSSWPDNALVVSQFFVFDPATSELSGSNMVTATSRY